jgi:glyoxylase-like metal-dependent hydrolase (beta-lactamase superfamily II)
MLVDTPPREIASNLWMLGTAQYPLYLFRGQQCCTIFEGGTGAMGPVLREQLKQIGVECDAVGQVVVTHAHPDHVMAVPLFREMFPRVSVLASEAASQTLSAEKAISFFVKMDDALTDSLIDNGVIKDEHRRPPMAEAQIAVDRILKDGDTIEVDDDTAFQVLETPGHSDCSLSFYEPKSKVLIISDATGYFLPQEKYWWPNYFTGYGPYVESIERLASLNADVLCLSHNAVVQGAEDVADYFQGTLDATRQYHERIVGEAKAGKTPREIAATLGEEVYQKTPLFPVQFFQKNCGLLVKLSLAHEGIGVEK